MRRQAGTYRFGNLIIMLVEEENLKGQHKEHILVNQQHNANNVYMILILAFTFAHWHVDAGKNTKHGSRSRAHTRSILHDPYPDPYPMILRDPYPRSIPLIHTLDPYPFLVEERLMLALMLLFILILLLVLVLLLPLLLPLFLLLPPLPPLPPCCCCCCHY